MENSLSQTYIQNLIDNLNTTTTIAFKYPTSNWELIWNNIAQFHKPKERLILFKYIHKILQTGDYLNKLQVFLNYSSLCRLLVRSTSLKHTLESCTHHRNKRNKLINDLKY